MPKVPKLSKGAQVAPRRQSDGLAFTYRPDGKAGAVADLTNWPGSEVARREAVDALITMTADDGGWRSQKTIDEGLMYVRGLLRWCEGHGVQTFAELDATRYEALRAEQEEQRTRNSYLSWSNYTRRFLREVAELPASTRMRARERVGSPDDDGSRDYYTVQQVRDLARAATRVLSKARNRVTTHFETVERAVREGASTPAEQMLLDVWNGDSRRSDYERRQRLLGAPAPATGPVTFRHYFMLTQQEVVAAAVLLVCRTGWNRSVVENLTTGSWSASTGADEDVSTVPLDKPRRQSARHSTSVLVDSGPSSQGAAWRMVVEATSPARAFLEHRGIVTDALLLRSAGGKPGRDTIWEDVRRGMPDHHLGRLDWLPDGLILDFPMLRRTHQTLIERSPAQNTFKTHVRSYLMKNPEVQDEMHATAAEGMSRMVARANDSLAVALTAEFDVPEDILSGKKDTATVACKDISHHPVTGLPCTESFLACLMCENAVATPRHLPRLVALHSALEDLRGSVTETSWNDLSDHHLRLTAFLFNSAQLNDDTYRRHLQAATESDRRNVRDLLGGNLDA